MSFHPLKLLGTVSARMRSALATCILVALTIAAIGCIAHPRTAAHSHGETLALAHHGNLSAKFADSAPQAPGSAEICVPVGRAMTEGQQTAPAQAPATAVPAVVTAGVSLPALQYRRVLRRLAANAGRSTLISVCRWRI